MNGACFRGIYHVQLSLPSVFILQTLGPTSPCVLDPCHTPLGFKSGLILIFEEAV